MTVLTLALPDMRRVKEMTDMKTRFGAGWRELAAKDHPSEAEVREIAHAWDPVRGVVTNKLRALFRGAQAASTTHLFLTAAGTGAFENPVSMMPSVFRDVLAEKEFACSRSCLQEVVFVIDKHSFGTWNERLKPTRSYQQGSDAATMWDSCGLPTSQP